jgi:uncharacterized BrkB/YihY/UPF0761 family membrane protein
MDWVLVAAASAAVAWIVENLMDFLLDFWRRRRAVPLTDAQVQRHHRIRFGFALAMLGYVLFVLVLLVAIAIESGLDAARALWIAGAFALAIYLWRVAARRYRRL